MSLPLSIPIIDIRARLPRAGWIIGNRLRTDSITLHWNGPAVPPARQRGAGVIQQLKADAEWQMRPGWGKTKHGAPHLMYHLCIDADGLIYQTADLNEQLWHCAHADGNANGLAFHFLVGEGQDVTPQQWLSGLHLIAASHDAYKVAKARVYGHLEWNNATACPGPKIMRRLLDYRAGAFDAPQPTVIPGLRRFRIVNCTKANVRQAPGVTWPDGRAVPIAGTLKAGDIVFVDVVKDNGQAVGKERRWVHMARVPNEQADLGFIHWSLVEEIH
jgi:hypothetical protein